MKLYKNHQHNASFITKNGFLCSRYTAVWSKSFFYAVAIQRLCKNAFFMQSPYSESYFYTFFILSLLSESYFNAFFILSPLSESYFNAFFILSPLSESYFNAFFILSLISESLYYSFMLQYIQIERMNQIHPLNFTVTYRKFLISKPPSYLRFTSSLILWEVNMKNEGGGRLQTSLVPHEAGSKLLTSYSPGGLGASKLNSISQTLSTMMMLLL